MGDAAFKTDDTTKCERAPKSREVAITRRARRDDVWNADNVNRSLKARIMEERRPGVRGCAWRAYVSFQRAIDALKEGDLGERERALREGEDWLKQAHYWAATEV